MFGPTTTLRLCGLAGPCQPRGQCVAGSCIQPPPTACRVGDLQVSLTWDDLGRDLELHLIRPGGRLNDVAGRSDCTWNTCVGSSPDWGVQGDATDDPVKDVDNVGAFGPENIALNRPAPGVYAVIVEHWGGGQPSTAELTLKVGTVTHRFTVSGLASRWVWDVARVDATTGTVTRIEQTFSCQASWSSGCTLPLP